MESLWVMIVPGIMAGTLGWESIRLLREGRRIRHKMRRAKPTRIRDVQECWAAVQGRIVPTAECVVAPWGHRPCVHFSLVVDQHVRKGTWKTLVEDQEWAPCAVDDGSGRLELDLTEAKLELETDVWLRPRLRRDMDPQLRQLLEVEYGVPTRTWLGTFRRVRLRQTVLEPNDPVYIIGWTTPSLPGSPGRIEGREGGPLLVSDGDERRLHRVARNRTLAGLVLGGLSGAVGVFLAAVWAAS